jgi:hypothetical protein
MKKIFLLFGLFGCYCGSAQMKDVFDIQKHLEKKSTDHKPLNVMPLIKNQFSKNLFKGNKFSELKSYSLLNGDRVIILPIDNMPCVVPDMKQFHTMPEISKNEMNNLPNLLRQNYFPGKIPNAASPFRFSAEGK